MFAFKDHQLKRQKFMFGASDHGIIFWSYTQQYKEIDKMSSQLFDYDIFCYAQFIKSWNATLYMLLYYTTLYYVHESSHLLQFMHQFP